MTTPAERPRFLAAAVQLPVSGFPSADRVDETMTGNAARMAAWIDAVCAIGEPAPRLFVFPALGLVGAGRRPPGLQRDAVAMTLPSPRIEPLLDACRRHGVYAATSTPETRPDVPGRVLHTGFLVGPEGVVLRSPKAQAYSAAGVTPLRNLADEYRAVAGEDGIYPVAETPLGRIAVLVEREPQVPEVSRLLQARGAEIVIHLSAEGSRVQSLFPGDALRQAMAFSHGQYWLAASFPRIVFDYPDGRVEDGWGGIGVIIGPDGEVLARATSAAGSVAMGWIDLAHLDRVREESALDLVPVAELFPWTPGARPAAELQADQARLPQVYPGAPGSH